MADAEELASPTPIPFERRGDSHLDRIDKCNVEIRSILERMLGRPATAARTDQRKMSRSIEILERSIQDLKEGL